MNRPAANDANGALQALVAQALSVSAPDDLPSNRAPLPEWVWVCAVLLLVASFWTVVLLTPSSGLISGALALAAWSSTVGICNWRLLCLRNAGKVTLPA